MTDRGAWSLAAGAAAAGVLAGVFLTDYWRRPVGLIGAPGGTAAVGPGAASGTGAYAPAGADGLHPAAGSGPSNADLERQVRELASKLETASKNLEDASRALREYHESEAARAPRPGSRPPGSFIPWLPPEGVPLVKAWYARELGKWARSDGGTIYKPSLEDATRMASDPDPNQAARGERIRETILRSMEEERVRAVRFREQASALAGIRTELELAKFLDEAGLQVPKPWQLAELAQELARGGAEGGK
ncbi:MAG: hypothetical protein L0216_18785 [Planctomycetales bacterium]|nr:hypothetical protein [Planctomycetales bacterium]